MEFPQTNAKQKFTADLNAKSLHLYANLWLLKF